MRSAGTEHGVLDVREASELEICELADALHAPMAEIPAKLDNLPTDRPLAVLRQGGGRNWMVVEFLRNAGFGNAVNLGIEARACETDLSMGAIASAHPTKRLATHAAA